MTSDERVNGITYYLPKTLLQIVIDIQQNTILATPIEITNLEQRYTAQYSASAFSDDAFCIQRSKKGLLQKIYFSANDRTDDVLLNVVQLAAQATKYQKNIAQFQAAVARVKAERDPKIVKRIIDPLNRSHFDDLNADLKRFGLYVEPLDIYNYAVSKGRHAYSHDQPFRCPENSICFATRVDVALQLKRNGRHVHYGTAEIVDPTGYGSIDIARAMMTTRVTKLELDDGVLTSVRVRKDSEAVAVSEFPLRAIERVLAVPGNGIALAAGSYEERMEYLRQRKLLKEAGAIEPPADTVLGLVEIDKCLLKEGT